jgi:hypothetical protein
MMRLCQTAHDAIVAQLSGFVVQDAGIASWKFDCFGLRAGTMRNDTTRSAHEIVTP